MSSKSLKQSSVLSRVVKCLMAHPEMLKSFWHNHIDQVPTSSFKTSVKFSLLDLIIVNATDHDSIPQFLTKNVICTIIQVLSKVETTTEEEDIVQGEGSLLFRDAKMSKGNKVVLKSPADLDSQKNSEE